VEAAVAKDWPPTVTGRGGQMSRQYDSNVYYLVESIDDDDGRLRVGVVKYSTSQLCCCLYTRR